MVRECPCVCMCGEVEKLFKQRGTWSVRSELVSDGSQSSTEPDKVTSLEQPVNYITAATTASITLPPSQLCCPRILPEHTEACPIRRLFTLQIIPKWPLRNARSSKVSANNSPLRTPIPLLAVGPSTICDKNDFLLGLD